MNFTRTAESKSGSLMAYVHGIDIQDVIRAFGRPDAEACIDREEGYDGYEYQFTNSQGGAVNLYARFGQFRIGGTDPRLIAPFAAFLTDQGLTVQVDPIGWAAQI